VVTKSSRRLRVIQINAPQRTYDRTDNTTMADYKNYLAASIISEENVVSDSSFGCPRNLTDTIAGYLPSSQSGAQSPCECSERVSDISAMPMHFC
jgi:hypothetical protein